MEAVVLCRIRLGHCGLNKTLHVLGRHESGLCGKIRNIERMCDVCRRTERVDFQKMLDIIGGFLGIL